MSHIFFSYCRADAWIMRFVAAYLRAEGFKIWVDEDLTPGSSKWQIEIQKAIKEAACMVVISTPATLNSEWVQCEIAFGENVKNFPVWASGKRPADAIPLSLINHQRVDIRDNYEKGMQKLVAAIKALPNPPWDSQKIEQTERKTDTISKPKEPPQITFRENFTEMERLINGTEEELWIFLKMGTESLIQINDELHEALDRKCKVHLLLCQPTSIILDLLADRGKTTRTANGLKISATARNSYLIGLQDNNSELVDIRHTPYIPPYTLLISDPELPNAYAFAVIGTFKTRTHAAPSFIVKKNDDAVVFAHFREQFEHYWNWTKTKPVDIREISAK